MSDAREKAWARYWPTRWFQPNDAGLDVDTFNAGWDAAKADMPDREQLAAVIYNSTPDYIADYRYRYAEKTAELVLSLLRGETNNG